MCLAIPGRVIEIDSSSAPRIGTVDFGGVRKRVCLDLVSGISPGDYVIVHVGFAISRLNEEEALKTLRLFEQMSGEE